MKQATLFILIAAAPLIAMAADVAPDATTPPSIEQQLGAFDRQVEAFYASHANFRKGVADFESKPHLKKITCTALKDFLPKTHKELKGNALALEKIRSNMSDDQQERFSNSQNRLEMAPTEIPECSGI